MTDGAPASEFDHQVIAERYTVTGLISRGGQSIVCRGRDQQTGRDVALKIMNEAAARDPEATGRFLREQEALRSLSGTNVVRVLDTCQTGSGALCLVLELLDGLDLEQFLQQVEQFGGRLTYRQTAEIVGPVVEALEMAHAQGIFHRDLKPANIFILHEGGVRLLDFGYARLRAAAPLTAIGMVMGSPSYIAPEVWRGIPEMVDHRVDVYSLAVILFRILTGKLPFSAQSLPEMLTLATTAPRPSIRALRPELPAEIDLWGKQALAIDPDERFRSVRALYSALFTSLRVREPKPSIVPSTAPNEAPARAVHVPSPAPWPTVSRSQPPAPPSATPEPSPGRPVQAPEIKDSPAGVDDKPVVQVALPPAPHLDLPTLPPLPRPKRAPPPPPPRRSAKPETPLTAQQPGGVTQWLKMSDYSFEQQDAARSLVEPSSTRDRDGAPRSAPPPALEPAPLESSAGSSEAATSPAAPPAAAPAASVKPPAPAEPTRALSKERARARKAAGERSDAIPTEQPSRPRTTRKRRAKKRSKPDQTK